MWGVGLPKLRSAMATTSLPQAACVRARRYAAPSLRARASSARAVFPPNRYSSTRRPSIGCAVNRTTVKDVRRGQRLLSRTAGNEIPPG